MAVFRGDESAELVAKGWYIHVVSEEGVREGDERVWKLVHYSRDRGAAGQRMRELVGQYWRGGSQEAERMLDRRRSMVD